MTRLSKLSRSLDSRVAVADVHLVPVDGGMMAQNT